MLLEFTQANHYVLPLMPSQFFDQHDPLSYVTAAMTKLNDNEQATLQLIVTPIKPNDAARLSRRILGNEDILHQVERGNLSRVHKASGLFGGCGTRCH